MRTPWDPHNSCKICNKFVKYQDRALCRNCKSWVHRDCSIRGINYYSKRVCKQCEPIVPKEQQRHRQPIPSRRVYLAVNREPAVPPTEVQWRILEDLADTNLTTRHTRSTAKEWAQELKILINWGWIACGNALSGNGHFLTNEGRQALNKCRALIINNRAPWR